MATSLMSIRNMPESPSSKAVTKPSVLIISDRWGKPFQGSIPAAIRTFAGIFQSLGLSTHCTVLIKKSEEEKEAEMFNVKLIGPEPRGSLRKTKPDRTWLLSHEAHYPNLRDLPNVGIVLGFGLATSEAAKFINDLEYKGAKFYIANIWQRDKIGENPCIIGFKNDELSEVFKTLFAEVKPANVMIPYDEEDYNYFSKIPDASCLKPILPQPNKRYYEFRPQRIPENDSDDFICRVLMFFAHDEEELPSYKLLVKAMNLVAKAFKTLKETPPKLIIMGVPEGKHRIISKELKTSFIDPIIPKLSSVDDIELELQCSHLVLIPESPGMNSLNLLLSVMAIGIPFITKRFSPCHNLIRKVVDGKMDIESMIDNMNDKKPDTLKDKVIGKLTSLRCSFNAAKTLRSLLEKSEFIKINNSEFTGKVREHTQIGTNFEDEHSLSHSDIPRQEGMVKSASVLATENQIEGKGRQTLHVEIKGGIPEKRRKMADVEKDYYNLDEVKHVSEHLNSRHPDLETGATSIECVKYSVFCKTLEALEFLWQQYESLELNKLITSVTITEETLKKIGAVYLEIETALDIEEYYECKKELEQTDQVSPALFAAQENGESMALAEKHRDLQSKYEGLRTEHEVLKRQKENVDAENIMLRITNEKLQSEEKKLSKIAERRKLDPPAPGTALKDTGTQASIDESPDDDCDGKKSPEKNTLRSTQWAQQLSDLKAKDTNFTNLKVLKYKVCKKLEYLIARGQGGTKVYLGIDVDQQTEVAVKCINYDSELQCRDIEHTISEMRSIKSCRNIVQYYDVITEDEFLYVVMELCERTLDAHLKHHDTMLPTERKNLVLDMFYGLKCLHDADIVHRDLKPQNILIGCDGTAKLTDFGISLQQDPIKIQNTVQTLFAGTPCWLSAEAISGKQGLMECSLKGDIQVAGMLAYYILSNGHHPFGTHGSLEEIAETQTNVTAGKYNLSHIDSVLAKHLISWMLENERQKRPSIKEVLEHPYVWEHSRCLQFLVKLATEAESGNVHLDGKESDKKWVDIAAAGDFKNELPDGCTGSFTEFLQFTKNCDIHGSQDKAAYYIMMEFPDMFIAIYDVVKGPGGSTSSYV